MEKESFFKNLMPLLPLLVVHIAMILIFSSTILKGDEGRYLMYAENLTQGFYTDASNPDLSNGPGYPLVLLPIVALGLPLFIANLLNGVFVFIGIFFFYKTLQLFTTKKYALIFAFVLGLYPPLLRWMVLLNSESFAFMLINGCIFYFCLLYQSPKIKRNNTIWAALFLGLLILTKVIFFQVLLGSLLLSGILFWTRYREQAKRVILVLAGALVVITPYIVYAYQVTDKLFYLGTRGGEILYHRATPHENEFGNWFSAEYILEPETIDIDAIPYQDLSELSANHRDFYLQLRPLSNIERDSAFKAKAFANMKEHPLKYLKNTVASASRLLFHYPISYRSQNLKAFGYIIPNMFLVVIFLLLLYPTYMARRRIPFEIKSQLIFVLIYGLGMILLSGKGRYFVVMVPAIVLFIAYAATNTLKFTLARARNTE